MPLHAHNSTDPFSDPPRWEVSPQTKATADEFFVLLDENGRGSIDLETARAHLAQPGITSNDINRIWCVFVFFVMVFWVLETN